MEQQIRKQGKFSGNLLKISLCFLIGFLCLIDAPEYVRCHHLGLCEFLEVMASLDTTQKAAKMMATLSRLAGPSPDRGVIENEADYLARLIAASQDPISVPTALVWTDPSPTSYGPTDDTIDIT
ncbi:MAG: hypothetical protein ACMUIA_01960, partial [bacterium]